MKNIKLTLLLLTAICSTGCIKNALDNIIPEHKVTPEIVVLGSSTAAGNGATPIDSAWVYRLRSTVNKTEIKANFVNLALAGYTLYTAMPTGYKVASRPAPDTARNITKALSYHPTLVMLSFPTNDIANNYTDVEIMKNYAVLAHVLDSAKVQYIIFGTQPRDFPDPAQRLRLKTLNDKIKLAYGSHVNDFLAQLSTSTYSIKPELEFGDGIHVNNAGHLIIVNATLNQPIFTRAINNN